MPTPDNTLVDHHLDAILRASGSALRHYTMAGTLAAMRQAVRDAMATHQADAPAGLGASFFDSPIITSPGESLVDTVEATRAPIAMLKIDADGNCAGATLYAPGLPPGKHDVYPAAVAPTPSPTPLIARSLSEWHEDDRVVCWWAWNGHGWAGEPPWIGTPNDSDWPGYHTHWTPAPDVPVCGIGAQKGGA